MSYIGSSATPLPVAFSSVRTQSFNGTGSQTAFTLSRAVAAATHIEVVVNNVQQSPFDSSYTVSGATLTFSEAPSSGTNNIYVVFRDQPLGTISATPTAVSDQLNTSTGYFDLPSGTTAQRPGSPAAGMIRHNTTTGYIEYYDASNSTWVGIGSFQASGGTLTQVGGYNIHTFTSSGTFTVLSGVKSVEYLIVAGGGGGATDGDVGGGGGGGGLITGTYSASPQAYSVVVGAGGTGGTNSYTPGTGGGGNGTQGGNSSLFGLTAIGGGYGGTRSQAGGSGGSGGGGGDASGTGGAGTSGQGYAGGNAPAINSNGGWDQGGGGGAGGAASSFNPGPGVSSSISGSAVTYAAGGRGMGPTTAAANTGNGGRGAATTADATGGSGIVIIRYLA